MSHLQWDSPLPSLIGEWNYPPDSVRVTIDDVSPTIEAEQWQSVTPRLSVLSSL